MDINSNGLRQGLKLNVAYNIKEWDQTAKHTKKGLVPSGKVKLVLSIGNITNNASS